MQKDKVMKDICYEQCLLDAAWTWAKGNDNMISYTASISVSTSCSRCNILVLASWTMTRLPHVQWTLSSWDISIYSIDTAL